MIVLDGELRMRELAINLGVLEASQQLPSHLEPDPSALGPKLPFSTWKELTDSPRLGTFTLQPWGIAVWLDLVQLLTKRGEI